MKTQITMLRKGLEMTQQDLSDIVEFIRQTIISLEQERYNPSLELAYRITKAIQQKHIENVFKLG